MHSLLVFSILVSTVLHAGEYRFTSTQLPSAPHGFGPPPYSSDTAFGKCYDLLTKAYALAQESDGEIKPGSIEIAAKRFEGAESYAKFVTYFSRQNRKESFDLENPHSEENLEMGALVARTAHDLTLNHIHEWMPDNLQAKVERVLFDNEGRIRGFDFFSAESFLRFVEEYPNVFRDLKLDSLIIHLRDFAENDEATLSRMFQQLDQMAKDGELRHLRLTVSTFFRPGHQEAPDYFSKLLEECPNLQSKVEYLALHGLQFKEDQALKELRARFKSFLLSGQR